MNSTQLKEIANNILSTVAEMQKRNLVSMITISYPDKTSCSFIPSDNADYSVAINEIIVAATAEANAILSVATDIEKNEDPNEKIELQFNEKIIAANLSMKAGDYITGIALLKEAAEIKPDMQKMIDERIADLQESIIKGL
jgi:hypothetical protein